MCEYNNPHNQEYAAQAHTHTHTRTHTHTYGYARAHNTKIKQFPRILFCYVIWLSTYVKFLYQFFSCAREHFFFFEVVVVCFISLSQYNYTYSWHQKHILFYICMLYMRYSKREKAHICFMQIICDSKRECGLANSMRVWQSSRRGSERVRALDFSMLGILRVFDVVIICLYFIIIYTYIYIQYMYMVYKCIKV